MRETEGKRDRVGGKPTGREEPEKAHDEKEPHGPDGADELAVPDYVMRDFGGDPGERTGGIEQTPWPYPKRSTRGERRN